jgi:hypothetical protein
MLNETMSFSSSAREVRVGWLGRELHLLAMDVSGNAHLSDGVPYTIGGGRVD